MIREAGFFFQAEDGIRDLTVTGVQTCALPIWTAGDSRFAPGGRDVLDCSKGIELLQADTARVRPESGEHVHGFGNTHYWLDPENARPITAAILEALARLAPGERSNFASRRGDFLKRLDEGIARWTRALGPFRDT